jgi:hypothetical protein
MRALFIPFLILLTGATAPDGCIFDASKADTGGEPDEIAVFGNACQPLEDTAVALPDDFAYMLSVQGVQVEGSEDVLRPIDAWVVEGDTLSVLCPAGTSSFIATYATTEIL